MADLVKIEWEEILPDDNESSIPISMEDQSDKYQHPGGDRCLFCWKMTPGKRFPDEGATLPGANGSDLVNQQLWALFVLLHVLEYPKEEITDLLKWGASPSDWFILCDVCEKTVRDAMAIYVNILKLTEDLKRVRNEARAVIQESLQENESNATFITPNDVEADVSKRIREYFKSNELSSRESSHFPDNSNTATMSSNASSKNKLKRPLKREQKKKTTKCSSLPIKKPRMNLTVEPQVPEQDNSVKIEGYSRPSSGQEDNGDDHNSDEEWTHSFDDCEEASIEDKNEYDYKIKPKRKKKPKVSKARKEQLLCCEICLSSRRFPTSNLLARHMRHHKIAQYPCPKCNYPCLSDPALERHLKRNKCNPQYEFKCDFCDFVTERRCNLNQHQTATHPDAVIEKEIFYKCDICGLKLRKRDQQQLDYHLLVHKYFENVEEIDGKLKCKICGELTIGNRDLRRHTREEHGAALGIPAFQCNICDKTFSREDSLENHVAVVHTKQCRYFCEQCGFGTMRKSCLEKHAQLHDTGAERPFVCELCAAPFKCERSFKMHMKRTHNPSRKSLQLKCKYCSYDGTVYENKSLLNRHMKEAHEDLYTHKCDQCENSYLSGASLQLHKKISHGGQEPVECQFCGRKVLSEFYLYGHQKSCRKKPPGFKFEASKI